MRPSLPPRLVTLWAPCALWFALHAPALPADDLDPDSRRVRTFEPDDAARTKWLGENDQPLALVSIDAAHGESLALPVAFPEPAAAWRGRRLPGQEAWEWSGATLVADRQLLGEPSTLIGRLEYDLWLPSDLPPGIRVQARVVLKNKDGRWYEALGQRRVDPDPDSGSADADANAAGADDARWEPAQALFPGWNRLRVDLSEEAGEFRPRGHGQAWSRHMLGQIREIGLFVQGDLPYRGTLALDDFTTWDAADRFEFAPPFRPLFRERPAPSFLDGALSDPDALPPGALREWRFTLNRPVLHPFRTRELKVDLLVTPPGHAPDAPPLVVPAYYDQPHRRWRGADGPAVAYEFRGAALSPTVVRAEPDRYVPVGTPVYRAKYRPPAPGVYTWRLAGYYRSPVTLREERFETPPATFLVASPGEADAPAAPAEERARRRGFVRVSERDPRYFAFADGSFFFPVGHSFRSPVDARHAESILRRGGRYPGAPAPADRGLRIYEDIFPRMEAAGMNACEVWMATWWLDLEWTEEIGGYHGLFGYNLENAYKLDLLVALARRHGQYLHLTLDNHGKGGDGVDSEWMRSPYRQTRPPAASAPDLPREPSDLFRHPIARELYRDKLRYVVGRWGQEPSIFAWELWSELDLTGSRDRHGGHYKSDYMRAWHREMAEFIRSIDPTGRPITTHYSGNHNVVDWAMAAEPFIGYVACDAYTEGRETLLGLLQATERRARPVAKPFLVTEFGGSPMGADIEVMLGHFMAGLWWGWMSETAGTPFNWWYEWIILEDLYRYYAAFSKFVAGEDKRRGPGEPKLTSGWLRVLTPPTAPEADGKANAPGPLASLALADGNVYYLLVYEPGTVERLPRDRAQREGRTYPAGARLRLRFAGEGPHTVEYWNVWTGEVVRTEDVTAGEGQRLDLTLPAFSVMTAVKVKAQTPRTAEEIAETLRVFAEGNKEAGKR